MRRESWWIRSTGLSMYPLMKIKMVTGCWLEMSLGSMHLSFILLNYLQFTPILVFFSYQIPCQLVITCKLKLKLYLVVVSVTTSLQSVVYLVYIGCNFAWYFVHNLQFGLCLSNFNLVSLFSFLVR